MTTNGRSWRVIAARSFACMIVLSVNVLAQTEDHGAESRAAEVTMLPDSELAAAMHRASKIREELERIGDHAWAGTYESPLTDILMITPECGAVAVGNCFMGPLYLIGHGDILEIHDNVIRLKLANTSDTRADVVDALRGRVNRLYEKMVAVRWGDWRFLVQEDRMRDFCNDVNAGVSLPDLYYTSYPCVEQYWQLSGEFERNRPPGAPSVPPAYCELLLDQPVLAAIAQRAESDLITVDRFHYKLDVHRTRMELDAGARQGVQVGMHFYLTQAPPFNVAEVLSVSDETCTAELRTYLLQGEPYDPPEIGRTLSTRVPDTASRKDRSKARGLRLWLADPKVAPSKREK